VLLQHLSIEAELVIVRPWLPKSVLSGCEASAVFSVYRGHVPRKESRLDLCGILYEHTFSGDSACYIASTSLRMQFRNSLDGPNDTDRDIGH